MRTKPLIATLAAVAALAVGIGVAGVSADPGHGKGGSTPPPYPPSSPTVVVSNSSPKVGTNIKVWYNGCRAGDTVTFTLASASKTARVKTSIRYERDYGVRVELRVPATPGPYTGTVTCSSGRSANFNITAVLTYTCPTGTPVGKNDRGGKGGGGGGECCPAPGGSPGAFHDDECDRALLSALMKKYDWLVD